MNKALLCSSCNEVLIKSMDSEVKLRCKVLVFKEDTVFAVCKGCDKELPVPLVFDNSLMKSVANSGNLRLFIKK